MSEITFVQAEAQHATNKRHQELLTCFKDELDSWCDYFAELRVWLFGSYLTDKEQPKDIDILLAGKLKPGTPIPPKLPRKHKANVHVISIIGIRRSMPEHHPVQNRQFWCIR